MIPTGLPSPPPASRSPVFDPLHATAGTDVVCLLNVSGSNQDSAPGLLRTLFDVLDPQGVRLWVLDVDQTVVGRVQPAEVALQRRYLPGGWNSDLRACLEDALRDVARLPNGRAPDEVVLADNGLSLPVTQLRTLGPAFPSLHLIARDGFVPGVLGVDDEIPVLAEQVLLAVLEERLLRQTLNAEDPAVPPRDRSRL